MRYELMRAVRGLLLCLGLTGLGLQASPEGYPHIRNYPAREYQASSANYAAVQNHSGLMYFANYRGVLEYDGASWRLIPMRNRSAVWSLATDSSGRVYVGGIGDFGYLAPGGKGQQSYFSLLDRLPEGQRKLSNGIRVIGAETGAFFHLYESRSLYYWDGRELHLLLEEPEGAARGSIFYYFDRLWYFSPDRGLLLHDGSRFAEAPGGEQFKGLRITGAIARPDQSLLVHEVDRGFFTVRIDNNRSSLRRMSTQIDQRLRSDVYSVMSALDGGRWLAGTIRGGAYVLDAAGNILLHLNEFAGLQDNLILGGFQDRSRSLWLTLSKGISRVEISSPLSHWGEAQGLRGLVFSSILHEGQRYASTPLGVFRLEGRRFQPVKGIDFESWRLVALGGQGAQRLLVSTVRGIYEIRGGQASPVAPGLICFDIYPSRRFPGRLYCLSGREGVEILELRQGGWTQRSFPGAQGQRFSSLVEDDSGALWFSFLLDPGSLYQALPRPEAGKDSFEIRRYGPEQQLPPVNNLALVSGRPVVLSDRGPYVFDGQGFVAGPFQEPMGPASISFLVEDRAGSLWMERLSGTRRWIEQMQRMPDGRYQRDSVILNSLANIEVWGRPYADEEGMLWIGTAEGLYCFDTRQARTPSVLPTPLLRKVAAGADSVLTYGACPPEGCGDSLPSLTYRDNSITFHYVAPFFDQPMAARYSYRLVGRDKDWSPWTEERKKDYTLLPPGEYEFQVRARNPWNEETPVARYRFRVAPPWYRTPWAFICYGLIVAGLIYGTVKFNTRRLYLRNEQLERMVYERTNEIWEQHKEIVKKTVALKRQKEEIAVQHDLLEHKNSELEKLILQLRTAQTQLVESEKMASLGQLTAGIAHEINNPINFVKGNIGPLKRDFEEVSKLFEKLGGLRDPARRGEMAEDILAYAEEIEAETLFEEMGMLLKGIEEGAARTTEIVTGLKVFSRSDADSFRLADLHDGLEATLRLLNNRTKERIAIHRDFEAGIPPIECLPGKLNQVFMNILTNAIQAIEKKAQIPANGHIRHYGGAEIGEIRISTRLLPNCLPGCEECVRISIRDSGTGIEPAIRSRIFDPFFTTKDVGEGTGLGLSITFGIIEQHHGRVEVDSKPGEWTEFIISLPLHQKHAAQEANAPLA